MVKITDQYNAVLEGPDDELIPTLRQLVDYRAAFEGDAAALNAITRTEKELRGRIINMFSSSVPAEDLIVDKSGAAKEMEFAIGAADTRFGVERAYVKGREGCGRF